MNESLKRYFLILGLSLIILTTTVQGTTEAVNNDRHIQDLACVDSNDQPNLDMHINHLPFSENQSYFEISLQSDDAQSISVGTSSDMEFLSKTNDEDASNPKRVRIADYDGSNMELTLYDRNGGSTITQGENWLFGHIPEIDVSYINQDGEKECYSTEEYKSNSIDFELNSTFGNTVAGESRFQSTINEERYMEVIEFDGKLVRVYSVEEVNKTETLKGMINDSVISTDYLPNESNIFINPSQLGYNGYVARNDSFIRQDRIGKTTIPHEMIHIQQQRGYGSNMTWMNEGEATYLSWRVYSEYNDKYEPTEYRNKTPLSSQEALDSYARYQRGGNFLMVVDYELRNHTDGRLDIYDMFRWINAQDEIQYNDFRSYVVDNTDSEFGDWMDSIIYSNGSTKADEYVLENGDLMKCSEDESWARANIPFVSQESPC